MKKTFFILALLLSAVGFSQTTVSGIYTANTTWGITGSPYEVTGDIQIPQGIMLTIEPGVNVNFKGDYQILINGMIQAAGTKAQPIQFTGDSVSIGKTMLMFKSADLSKTLISHTNFTGPKFAIQLGDESIGAEDPVKNDSLLQIDFGTFTNTGILTKGLLTNAVFKISNSIISNTLIKTVDDLSEGITFVNSSLSSDIVESYSIWDGKSFPRTSLLNFKTCTITNCTFKANNSGFFDCSIAASPFSDCTNVNQLLRIINCNVLNSPMDIPRTELDLSESIVNYNSPVGIRFGLGGVTCSQIIGNGRGTALRLVKWEKDAMPGLFHFNNNTFSNNEIAVEILSDLADRPWFDSCNFINNNLYHIKNLATKFGVDASDNWWGTTDEVAIEDKIYDITDDATASKVISSSSLKSAYHSLGCMAPYIIEGISDNGTKTTTFDAILYPNPCTSSIMLHVENANSISTLVAVEISNLNGQVVYKKKLTSSPDQLIDVSELAKGMYFCKINLDNKTVTKKLLVQ